MTVEEIKSKFTMTDVMERYGVKIRNNMCSCPFHKDEHPSMKVYKDGAHCFSCGWHGDIFTFIQDMDHCDFKTAFRSLGGTYENYNDDRKRVHAKQRIEAEQKNRDRKKEAEQTFFHELKQAIEICKKAESIYEPFSEGWTFAINKRQFLEYAFDCKYIEETEVNEINVSRVCRKVRQRFLL